MFEVLFNLYHNIFVKVIRTKKIIFSIKSTLPCGSHAKLLFNFSSTDEEISSRLFTPKKVKSVTPRPNDVVCHTTELTARPGLY